LTIFTLTRILAPSSAHVVHRTQLIFGTLGDLIAVKVSTTYDADRIKGVKHGRQ